MWKITAGSADDDARDLRLKNGSGTHQAGLVRTVDDAVAQIRCAKGFAGIIHRVHFGVCKDGFFRRFAAPIARDHFALARYDGTDRQFTRVLGLTCLLYGKLHILLVSVHTASLQSPRPFPILPKWERRDQPARSNPRPPINPRPGDGCQLDSILSMFENYLRQPRRCNPRLSSKRWAVARRRERFRGRSNAGRRRQVSAGIRQTLPRTRLLAGQVARDRVRRGVYTFCRAGRADRRRAAFYLRE